MLYSFYLYFLKLRVRVWKMCTNVMCMHVYIQVYLAMCVCVEKPQTDVRPLSLSLLTIYYNLKLNGRIIYWLDGLVREPQVIIYTSDPTTGVTNVLQFQLLKGYWGS